MIQQPLLPMLWFDQGDLREGNLLLQAWGHRNGALRRPMGGDLCHLLVHRTEGPVLVITTSSLIRDCVGGGLSHLTRENTLELSRLCARRPGLCRLGIRLWREFVFPSLGSAFAISYQDADMHNGATYRFDGWGRSPRISHSGADKRSGRRGVNKWVWVWPAAGADPAPTISPVPCHANGGPAAGTLEVGAEGRGRSGNDCGPVTPGEGGTLAND